MKKLLLIFLLTLPFLAKSQNYSNPIIHADYSDPDLCRVGEDFYMTASSFNCLPGLPILHSKDLVHWNIISHAIPRDLEPLTDPEVPHHGKRVFAPSIRHHDGFFYIFWGDPDQGAFMVKSASAEGPWTRPVLVKKAVGIIDTCPLWDDDGKVYMVHAYAASRSGLNSVLAVCELSPDATQAITPSRIIYDGHEDNATCEGPKFYKKDGWYYIFHPAGGVQEGWQVVQRSRNVYGPYEHKTVLAQGQTAVNGPHQGGWVTTPSGEDWFIHFQDKGAYGRIVHLQPMSWKGDWPVIGSDPDGDGCGEPVMTYALPDTKYRNERTEPQENDEFEGPELGLQWQWQANVDEKWSYLDTSKGVMRLYSASSSNHYGNLWDAGNLLLQKFPAENFTAMVKLSFHPSEKFKGERTGLVVFGRDYSGLFIENTDYGLILSQTSCKNADLGGKETIIESRPLEQNQVYLKVEIARETTPRKTWQLRADCKFSYSLDGRKFIPMGIPFKARQGMWIGAKTGVFCTRPEGFPNKQGGWTDVDWFRIRK